MKKSVRILAILIAGVATQVLADEPQAAPTEPASPPALAAPAAEASADASEAATKPTRIYLEDKTLTNEEIKQLFSQGYKPVGRNGQVYYCRNEAKTGSRFMSMTCKTADQMKQLARESRDMLTAKQKTGGCRANGAGC